MQLSFPLAKQVYLFTVKILIATYHLLYTASNSQNSCNNHILISHMIFLVHSYCRSCSIQQPQIETRKF